MTRVSLHLFAVARQRAGAPVVTLELPEGATVSTLKSVLVETFPALAPIVPSLMIAIDNDYATDDTPIPPDAELAAIPPVSGG